MNSLVLYKLNAKLHEFNRELRTVNCGWGYRPYIFAYPPPQPFLPRVPKLLAIYLFDTTGIRLSNSAEVSTVPLHEATIISTWSMHIKKGNISFWRLVHNQFLPCQDLLWGPLYCKPVTIWYCGRPVSTRDKLLEWLLKPPTTSSILQRQWRQVLLLEAKTSIFFFFFF